MWFLSACLQHPHIALLPSLSLKGQQEGCVAILTNLLWLKRLTITMGVSVFNSSLFPSIMSWSNRSNSFHIGLSVSSTVCRQRQEA